MGSRYRYLLTELRSLGLPIDDYVIFGSAPLVAHGLRDDVHDLDLIARGVAWAMALERGRVECPASGHGRMVRLCSGDIEVFDAWVSSAWGTDELIDNRELIDGLPFVPLPVVYRWKIQANRPKDQPDIRALRSALT